ncbi:hypothetical protein EVG20_g9999, partial [Dentipellis fragilis]
WGREQARRLPVLPSDECACRLLRPKGGRRRLTGCSVAGQCSDCPDHANTRCRQLQPMQRCRAQRPVSCHTASCSRDRSDCARTALPPILFSSRIHHPPMPDDTVPTNRLSLKLIVMSVFPNHAEHIRPPAHASPATPVSEERAHMSMRRILTRVTLPLAQLT